MSQLFKTISFPKERSGTNRTEIVRLAFNKSSDIELYNALKDLKSSDVRSLLPEKNFQQLNEIAESERRSLNQFCLLLLSRKISEIKKSYGNDISISHALSKNLTYTDIDKKTATFAENKTNKIHRLYPYIEGYSCGFVQQIIDKLPYKPNLIYDPFAGVGTTQIVASHNNIPSSYSEINPFMQFVIECKTNKIIEFIDSLEKNSEKLQHFVKYLNRTNLSVSDNLYNTYTKKLGTDQYFEKATLKNILQIKLAIERNFSADPLLKNMALFALSTIIVTVSNTIRRADLRYKYEDEKKYSAKDVFPMFCQKILEFLSDVNEIKDLPLCKTEFASCDAQELIKAYDKKFDLVITSPPYVNGTNYFRNSKLELILLDFVNDYEGIGFFTKQAITSGINNVVKKDRAIIPVKNLAPILAKLKKCAYDKRIPVLIESYFSDMHRMFSNVSHLLHDEAYFYLDIGDSQFANVYIPTDQILTDIAKTNSLELIDSKFIRERHSKNGMLLKQVLLLFKKSKQKTNASASSLSTKSKKATELLRNNYREFKEKLPYKEPPYNSRNWGHGLHSLCSYQGKLKPSLAHFLIKYFSNKGMRVLDPLCGVGTLPLEACLQGRIGMGNDLSLLAYVNTLAKVKPSQKTDVLKEFEKLKRYVSVNLVSKKEAENTYFGYNRNITEYYHVETFREILTAREYFKKVSKYTPEKALILSSLLHILHGNRPYALSRRSHNVTPIAPQGPFEHKSLSGKLLEKVERILSLEYPSDFHEGDAFNMDYEEMDKQIDSNSIDLIITSPPFVDSTRFYMSNWLRMWFCGWDKEDFETKKLDYLETKQIKNISIYRTFFKMCTKLLAKDGVVIMHMGKSEKYDMGREISIIAKEDFEIYGLLDENVSHCEKFGIKDQGATKTHQLLFLTK